MVVRSLEDNNACVAGTAGYSVTGYRGNVWGAFVDGALVATFRSADGRWCVTPAEPYAHPDDGQWVGRTWRRAVSDLSLYQAGRRVRPYIRRFLGLVFVDRVDVREAAARARLEFLGF